MEKKELTNWQTVGIGALVGFVSIFLWFPLLVGNPIDIWKDLFRVNVYNSQDLAFYLLIPPIVGGILGAVNRKGWKVWFGAICGAILGQSIGIGLIYLFGLGT